MVTRACRLLLAVAIGVVALSVSGIPAAFAAWTPTDSNTSSLTTTDVAETVNGNCFADGAAASSVSCGTANILPNAGSTTAPTLANSGSLATSYKVSATNCGAATLADNASAALTVAHGGFTSASYRVSGPLSGYGVNFDGSSNWLGTGGTGTIGPQTYTELAWFKTTTSSYAPLLSFGNSMNPANSTNMDRFLWIDTTGHLVAGVYSGGYQEAVSSSTINDGNWHLVAVTLSGSGLKIYVDGALQTTKPAVTSAFTYAGAWWTVGAGNLDGWPDAPALNSVAPSYFTGSLAGVAILPTALSASSITSIYGSASISAYATTVAGLSPIHYWALQDAAPTAATASTATLPGQTPVAYPDLSTNGDTATVRDGVTASSSGPLGGTASASFDGTGILTTANHLTGPQTYTQLAWFKTSADSGVIMQFASSPSQPSSTITSWDRQLWIDPSGYLVAGVFVAGTPNHEYSVTSTSKVDDNAWHLAAVTLSSTSMKLYLDGSLQATNTSATSAQVATGYWFIGAGKLSTWADAPTLDSDGMSWFNGSLAGVAVTTGAATSSNITTFYTESSFANYISAVNGSNPLALWPLTSSSSTPQYPDLSGNFNDASATGTVSALSSGPLSSGASTSFDGSTGYLASNSSLTGPANYTELAWFKSSSSTGGTIIGFQDTPVTTTASSHDRLIWLNNSGHVYAGSDANNEVATTGTYNDGAWHLVAATLSASSGLSLYVDGSLIGTPNASVKSAAAFTGRWTVGAGDLNSWSNASTVNANGVGFFNGSLAGTAVLPSALSGAQVSALYGSATFDAYSGAVLNDSPSNYWSLLAQANACSAAVATVSITLAGVTTCLFPALSAGTTCPAFASGGLPLVDLFTAGLAGPVTATVGQTATLTIAITDNAALFSPLRDADVLLDFTVTAAHTSGWRVAANYLSGQTRL